MAKETSSQIVGLNPNDFEWENIHEEAPDTLIFDTVGDMYVGQYEGHNVIYPDGVENQGSWFIQLRWRDNEGLKVTNAGYDLQTTFVDVQVKDDGTIASHEDKISPGTVTRVSLVKLVDVGQASPMKSFRVDCARRKG